MPFIQKKKGNSVATAGTKKIKRNEKSLDEVEQNIIKYQ